MNSRHDFERFSLGFAQLALDTKYLKLKRYPLKFACNS